MRPIANRVAIGPPGVTLEWPDRQLKVTLTVICRKASGAP